MNAQRREDRRKGGALLSEAERQSLHDGVLKARRFAEFWTKHAHELMKDYGGEWVLVADTRVVGHDPDPSRLEAARKALEALKKAVTLWYVPRPNERFVL